MKKNKPTYVNQKIKRISRKKLLKILHDQAEKMEAQRRADNQALSEALRSGIYCTGGRSNIKPLL